MAKLSPDLKRTIRDLQEQLLETVDEAKATEFTLLEHYGETNATQESLETLTEISQQAGDFYSQVSKFLLRAAEAQPTVTSDMLMFLLERVKIIQNRIPALERSIQEIKVEWNI